MLNSNYALKCTEVCVLWFSVLILYLENHLNMSFDWGNQIRQLL